jgi:FkbM family methyltransferase
MIDKVVNFEHDILIPKCDVYIKNVIQSQGKWEKNVYTAYKEILNKDSIVIEVGAHVGTHTVEIAKLSKHVYTFEIQRFLNQLLSYNLINNECFNVTNFLEIAGNDNNILPIEEISYADDRMFNTGVMTVQGLNKPWGYPILQTKLDNKFNFLNRCDLLKIDAEGSEVNIIKGALQLINKTKPAILVEFDGDKDKQEMLALLPNYKFKDVIDIYSAGTVVYENKMMIGEHHDTPA